MEYKIEYKPGYAKKKILSRKIQMLSKMLPLLGLLMFACLVWIDRENVASMAAALEQMAVQLEQGESVAEAFSAFSQLLQGGTCG